ncbi:hypothetical protein LRS56_13085 [Pseudomonas poae]|nr:hypothetical protein LRS56_13085 [Pseudomonas poae]
MTTSADKTNKDSDAAGLAATTSVGVLSDPVLAAPEVPDAPEGFIPVRFQFEDLPVLLNDPWPFLAPDGESDYVTFIWHVEGSVPFDLEPIELPGPLTVGSFPIRVVIPQGYFQNNAIVNISYRINNVDPNSTVYESSFATRIVIDRTPPGGGLDLGPARFLIDPITEADLNNNATIGVEVLGDYLNRRPQDTVLCYLSSSPSLPVRPAIYEQTFVGVTGPMIVQIPVAEIRRFAGAPRLYFFYKLRDRSGNPTPQYSAIASAALVLNAPPANLSPPEVPAYESDLLVNREDARRIVSVRVRQYDNGLPGDRCIVEWDGIRLAEVPVNALPLSVEVAWSVLIANGANLRRISNLPVRYYIFRAADTLGPGVPSSIKRIVVDMTIAGQENPQAPALLNRLLAPVNIHGAVSTTPNRLDSRDANQPVRASFTLFDNPVVGQQALLFWPSRTTPVATYRVKSGDVGGTVKDFDNLIDWQVIQDGGSNATTLVNYRTDNGVNQQLSPDQTVFVSLAPPINYTRPTFPQSLQHPNRYLNCDTQPPVWLGIEVLVSPSPSLPLPGDVVRVTWQGYKNYPDRTPITTTLETFDYIWGTSDTSHSFWIRPYESLIRPLRDYAGGSARYSVLRNGILVGTSATAYVQIDRKSPGAGNYCGPNGFGPES